MHRLADCADNQIPLTSPLHAAISNTIQAIDRVDTLPKVQSLVVEVMVGSRRRRAEGMYLSDAENARVIINPHANEPHFTFTHEIGHFLDNRMLQPLTRSWGSHYVADFEPLMEALVHSPPSMRVQKILSDRRRHFTRRDRADLLESQWPNELFARAYAQWIAAKSQADFFAQEVQQRLLTPVRFADIPIIFQWEEAEFHDIIEQKDGLFKNKGLL